MAEEPVNVRDFSELARARMSEASWNYLCGGVGDEHTLAWNEQAWTRLRLSPHVLVDVSHVDTTTHLLELQLPHPVALAPTAGHRNVHAGAESETRRGADLAQALVVLSTLGHTPVEDVGRAGTGPWWWQVYVHPDRGFTGALLQRVEAAGAGALVLTVDLPVPGARDRDRRLTPGGTFQQLVPPNLVGAIPRPPALDAKWSARTHTSHTDPSLSWADLDWLLGLTSMPVLLKGVLRPDDAARAVEHGVAGVVVSNHGARNLDTAVATADALPAVVDAVAGRAAVLVDGGIRRGTDIAKALCLGADAVLVGRPYLWGLAAAGADGIRQVVEMLRTELCMAMALLGAPEVTDLTPDLLLPPA